MKPMLAEDIICGRLNASKVSMWIARIWRFSVEASIIWIMKPAIVKIVAGWSSQVIGH